MKSRILRITFDEFGVTDISTMPVGIIVELYIIEKIHELYGRDCRVLQEVREEGTYTLSAEFPTL